LVVERLESDWSPEQIAAWLKLEFAGQPEMQISHEAIYLSLFVQGRGALRRELSKHLRTQRGFRHPKRHQTQRGQIRDRVMISERPAEVADRAVPGHWEGDLLMGTPTDAIGTLVERSSRFVMLFQLPGGAISAEGVRTAMAATIQSLPASLRRSLTWDQGSEMAEHVQFSVDTGVAVYFCDPYKPWQRGTNENTNGLLRQYFPKGRSLVGVSRGELDAVADKLNGRPRKTLGWRTPAHYFEQLRYKAMEASDAPTA
jgi:IS30 family transposase